MTIMEPEGQPPVAVDPDRPPTLRCPLQRVEPEARHIHIPHRRRCIERCKKHPETGRVSRLYAGKASRPVEASQAFVPERYNHSALRDTQQVRMARSPIPGPFLLAVEP